MIEFSCAVRNISPPLRALGLSIDQSRNKIIQSEDHLKTPDYFFLQEHSLPLRTVAT